MYGLDRQQRGLLGLGPIGDVAALTENVIPLIGLLGLRIDDRLTRLIGLRLAGRITSQLSQSALHDDQPVVYLKHVKDDVAQPILVGHRRNAVLQSRV